MQYVLYFTPIVINFSFLHNKKNKYSHTNKRFNLTNLVITKKYNLGGCYL